MLTTKYILIIILGAALVLIALIIMAERKRKGKSKRSGYIEALYALIDGDRNKALDHLKNAVKSGEEDTGAYILLGDLLRDFKQPGKALQVHRSMSVRKDLSEEEKKAIQISIAEDLGSLGRVEEAIETLEKIKRKRRSSETLYALHKFYHITGDYRRAFKNLKELINIDAFLKEDIGASYMVAVAQEHLQRNESEEAVKYSELALKEDSNYPPALYISGLSLMKDGQTKKALDRWIHLLENDISYFRGTIGLMEETLFEEENFQEMQKILEKIYSLYPGNPEVFYSLVKFHERKGELEEIFRIFEKERGQLRMDDELKIKMVSVYIENSRIDEAVDILKMDTAEKILQKEYFECESCGHRSEIPLSYCRNCLLFNTLRRKYEKFPV